MTAGPSARVTLLGTGCPTPDLERMGPSQVVWAGGQPLLVDCGHGVLYQLIKAGIDPTTITNLFVTHLHSDHYAGLIHLVMGSWNLGRNSLRIFGPEGTRRFIDVLFGDLMARDIEFRIAAGRDPQGMQIK